MKLYISSIIILLTFNSFGQNFDEKIEKLINENLEQTVELRHWFHENAELSNREFKTAERIANELTKIGYKPLKYSAKRLNNFRPYLKAWCRN